MPIEHRWDLPGSVQRTSPHAWGLRLREVWTHASQNAWTNIAFSSAERDRHLEVRPISQLNTQPMVSPVNASRLPSRVTAHHSGPRRWARPYLVEDFHLLSFASLSWRTLQRVDTKRWRNPYERQLRITIIWYLTSMPNKWWYWCFSAMTTCDVPPRTLTSWSLLWLDIHGCAWCLVCCKHHYDADDAKRLRHY